MSWIDERLEQKKELTWRNNLVANGAEPLFNELWNEVFAQVTEAHEKGLDLRTNGSSFERVVLMFGRSAAEADTKLIVALDREKEEISATWGDHTVSFEVDMCDDGVVCLKRDGKQIFLQPAAKLILDPFLFPELQPKNDR